MFLRMSWTVHPFFSRVFPPIPARITLEPKDPFNHECIVPPYIQEGDEIMKVLAPKPQVFPKYECLSSMYHIHCWRRGALGMPRTESRRVGESVLPGRAAGEYQCRGVLLMMSYFRVLRYFGASVLIASNFTGSNLFPYSFPLIVTSPPTTCISSSVSQTETVKNRLIFS